HELAADEGVVAREQLAPGRVAELRRALGRGDDVREHDRGEHPVRRGRRREALDEALRFTEQHRVVLRVGPAEPVAQALDLAPARARCPGRRETPPRPAPRWGGARAAPPARPPPGPAPPPPPPSGGTRPPRRGSRCAAGTRRTTRATPRSGLRRGSAGVRARR